MVVNFDMASFITSIPNDRQEIGQPSIETISIDFICCIDVLVVARIAYTSQFFIPTLAFGSHPEFPEINSRFVRYYHFLDSSNSLVWRVGADGVTEISTSRYSRKGIQFSHADTLEAVVESRGCSPREYLLSLSRYRFIKAIHSRDQYLYCRISCIEYFESSSRITISGAFELPEGLVSTKGGNYNAIAQKLDQSSFWGKARFAMTKIRYFVNIEIMSRDIIMGLQLEDISYDLPLANLEFFV